MFGERYFLTRERLAEVIRGIADLATETHVKLTPDSPVHGGDPNHPFLFVVCGEVNAGKSSFLNGLFGCDICPTNVLPETRKMQLYRHHEHADHLTPSDSLEIQSRPESFLRNFNLLDTPGTDAPIDWQDDALTHWLPNADLIACIFPVTNPWGSSTWNFISRFPAAILNKVVFVIQQTDQREAADIAVILDHVADLSMKRLGCAPPIFAVSAMIAREAKQTANPKRLAASGYPELERHLSQTICLSPARRKALEAWRTQAALKLRTIEDHIEGQHRAAISHDRFIQSIEQEIDQIRETFVRRLPIHLAGVATVFETEAVWVTRMLRRRLGALASMIRLFTGDRTGIQMESMFIERLQQTVMDVAQQDGDEAVAACRKHWTELGPRVMAATGIDLGECNPLDHAKNLFVSRLGRAAEQGVGNLKVRNRLDKELRNRNTALQSFVFTTLVFILGGAISGSMNVPWLPWILMAVATLFLASGIWVAWVTRKSITRDFQQRLLDTCGAFANTLHSDYEEALRWVFRDHSSSLHQIRTRIAQKQLTIEPHMRRWQDLFLTLKALEQEL